MGTNCSGNASPGNEFCTILITMEKSENVGKANRLGTWLLRMLQDYSPCAMKTTDWVS